MPRSHFVADLQQACNNVSLAAISRVKPGASDGEVTLTCVIDGKHHDVSLLVLEVADYPTSHICMLFGSDSLPPATAKALDAIADDAAGKKLSQILQLVSKRLVVADEYEDEEMPDSQYFDELEEADEDDDYEHYFPDDDGHDAQKFSLNTASMAVSGVKPTLGFRERVRADLLLAKSSDFKVGVQGSLMDGGGCFVSLSCRIAKLGISTEAMEAWKMEPSEYLILILSYPSGYKSMESVLGYDSVMARQNFSMRVGISDTYKPTMQEAIQAFTSLSKEQEKRREEAQSQQESQTLTTTKKRGFRDSFISGPLNGLLEERFTQLLKYRFNGMSWTGAEAFYTDRMGTENNADLGLADKYMASDDARGAAAYPPIVMADHVLDSTALQKHSLPLVSMQFVLRHFVRCTEFCLICFSKMPDELQAIKPYVCENPLCLFQYMTLGFGPSVEHEILSQPKVVDLLISFCYVSAYLHRLKDFPTGLGLMVPPASGYEGDGSRPPPASTTTFHNAFVQPHHAPAKASTGITTEAVPPMNMKYNEVTKEIMFEDKNAACPVRVGDWIIIRMADPRSKPLHCRVSETAYYPTVRVGKPVTTTTALSPPSAYPNGYYPYPGQAAPAQTKKPAAAPTPVDEFLPASFHKYDQNFDELNDHGKRGAIMALLNILPSIEEMAKYLQRKTRSPLSSWVDRLPSASLGVLRWIIASNRACIMQVAEPNEKNASGRQGQDRLYGMPGWSQFRFAMGAPDKERKFIQAIRETTSRLKLKKSTLFAWHGSPLHNWHGIIREGLHFKDTVNGRAYGHGVYHSLDCNTSISYSGFGNTSGGGWPASALKVSQALALNEIVNAPREFVSSSPHLVVNQLDWIQTRFLFVKTDGNSLTSNTNAAEAKPFDPVDQDEKYFPRGVSGKNIIIPQNAIAGSRRPKTHAVSSTNNKRFKASGSAYDPIELDQDDDASVATLDEDLAILQDDTPMPSNRSLSGVLMPSSQDGGAAVKTGFFRKLLGKSPAPATPLTDYEPCKLDYKTLPMLKMPTWATMHATRRLMRDLQDLVKVQETQPLHELGWHIDADMMENMYQWIVEFHSFEAKLPLAQDMKKKNIKSIVMELRFGKDYPMSPPFVRVVRPRFLSFQHGGGGHVTAGGAMCMQLLTNDGWSAVSSLESVLLQVRLALTSPDPRPARLENGGRMDYGVGEAVEAYIRACAVHGWTVPQGFKETAYGGGDGGQ